MNKYKTLILAAAAALVTISPAGATGQEKREVALEIGTYSIDTARSEASISKLLAKQGFIQGPQGSTQVVIGGVEKASDALEIFGDLAAPSEVGTAMMRTSNGIAAPFSVGQTVDYVNKIVVTQDEKGRKHVVRQLGEAESGLFVSLTPKVRKGGVVDVKIKSDLARVRLENRDIDGERLQLLHRRTYFLDTKAKLRADQAAVYVRYIPAEKRTLFKAGEVLVTVVKAKVVK